MKEFMKELDLKSIYKRIGFKINLWKNWI